MNENQKEKERQRIEEKRRKEKEEREKVKKERAQKLGVPDISDGKVVIKSFFILYYIRKLTKIEINKFLFSFLTTSIKKPTTSLSILSLFFFCDWF